MHDLVLADNLLLSTTYKDFKLVSPWKTLSGNDVSSFWPKSLHKQTHGYGQTLWNCIIYFLSLQGYSICSLTQR